MSKRRKQTIEKQAASAESQRDDDNYDLDHFKRDAAIETSDTSAFKQLFLEKLRFLR